MGVSYVELRNPFSYQLKITKDAGVRMQTVDIPETFNYLLGISVQTRRCFFDNDRRYLVYRGTVGQNTCVIIWRSTKDWNDEDWEQDCRFIEKHNFQEGADKVYVNTHSIVHGTESLDPLFNRLMFSQ